MTEQVSEGSDRYINGIDHPADGTMSPTISNDRDVVAELDSIKAHVDDLHGKPARSGTTVTWLDRLHEHYEAFRQDLEHALHMTSEQAHGGKDEE